MAETCDTPCHRSAGVTVGLTRHSRPHVTSGNCSRTQRESLDIMIPIFQPLRERVLSFVVFCLGLLKRGFPHDIGVLIRVKLPSGSAACHGEIRSHYSRPLLTRLGSAGKESFVSDQFRQQQDLLFPFKSISQVVVFIPDDLIHEFLKPCFTDWSFKCLLNQPTFHVSLSWQYL